MNEKVVTARMSVVAKRLGKTSFYEMPASSHFHSCYRGGLLQHSLNVWNNLEILTTQLGLTWGDPSSPFIIAMLHDACKIDAYSYNPDYGVWEAKNGHRSGHGELSLEVCEELGIPLTDEEKACIRWHMGSFDDVDNWNKYTDAIHNYPNVLYTHVADMMATHINEVDEDDTEISNSTHKRAVKKCCLCGKLIFDEKHYNNPAPLSNTGVCCDECNFTKVIPARMEDAYYEE